MSVVSWVIVRACTLSLLVIGVTVEALSLSWWHSERSHFDVLAALVGAVLILISVSGFMAIRRKKRTGMTIYSTLLLLLIASEISIVVVIIAAPDGLRNSIAKIAPGGQGHIDDILSVFASCHRWAVAVCAAILLLQMLGCALARNLVSPFVDDILIDECHRDAHADRVESIMSDPALFNRLQASVLGDPVLHNRLLLSILRDPVLHNHLQSSILRDPVLHSQLITSILSDPVLHGHITKEHYGLRLYQVEQAVLQLNCRMDRFGYDVETGEYSAGQQQPSKHWITSHSTFM